MSNSANYRIRRDVSRKGNLPVTAGASATTVVSGNETTGEFPIHFGQSLLVACLVDDVTNTSGTAVLTLQHATMKNSAGAWNWTTVRSSAALTTSATEAVVEIRVNETDAAFVAVTPLGIVGRVVAVTGIGDTLKVLKVHVVE